MRADLQPHTGACRLDRDFAVTIRINEEALDTLDQLAKESSRNTVIEAAMRSHKDGRSIPYHMAIIDNENKKYPREIPASDEPELTPEVAYANMGDTSNEEDLTAYLPSLPMLSGDVVTSEATPQGPNPWTLLHAALIQCVGEENFETWLSCIRFLGANETTLALAVPNTFFQEYLSAHYTEVIQEELRNSTGKHFEIEFSVQEIPQPPQPQEVKMPTRKEIIMGALEREKVDTLDKLEDFEDRLLTAIHQRRLDEAAERCTRYQGDALTGRRVVGFNDARMAEEVAILKAARLKEDKRREEFRKQRRAIFGVQKIVQNLRQPGTPQHQRQYETPSAFATEGGATRRDRANAERAFRKPAPS